MTWPSFITMVRCGAGGSFTAASCRRGHCADGEGCSGEAYGAPSIHAELADAHGIHVGKK
jgi:hypothetical protein